MRTLSELSGKKYKTTGTTKEQFMALKGNMDEGGLIPWERLLINRTLA